MASSNGAGPVSMVEAALGYAARGWFVFPLRYAIFDKDGTVRCSCDLGATCEHIGKHPWSMKTFKNGFKSATNDPGLIKTIWTAYSEANIGIATGKKSGIFVLDVDPRHGGDKTLGDRADNMGTDLIVLTGGGGTHFYFAYDPEHPVGSHTGVLKGIDVKGDGGYVVAPLSNQKGGYYRWKHEGDVIVMPGTAPAFVMAAIDDVQKADRKIPFKLPDVVEDGTRNKTATSFAGLLRYAGASPAAILAALRTENADGRYKPPLDDHALQAIANQSAKWETGDGRERTRTESANAERLVKAHGPNLHHVARWGRWFYWDDKRWAVDETQRVLRLSKTVVRAIPNEIQEDDDKEFIDAHNKWAKASESRAKREAMVALASAEETIKAGVDDFDKDPMLFNCLTGTIDLKTGKLGEHHREDMITMLAPVEYDPNALCPLWDAHLHRIFDGNQGLIDYVQRVAGYCLTGSVKEQVYFFLYGLGHNGKTKFREALMWIMGDYAKPADFTSFVTRTGDGPRNDIARLVGARAVMVSEVGENRKLDESLMKEITGGDKITARFLNHEFFDFYPQFKLIFAGNHKPIIKGTDKGTWRRPQVIPFNVEIPVGERDKDLGEKLQAEASGILRWAVEGCMEWRRLGGLQPPPEVIAATKMYQTEMDELGDFLSERCLKEPDAQTLCDDLYLDYQQWAEASGEKAFTKNKLGRMLTERGYVRGHVEKGSTYKGLRLKNEKPGI